MIDITKVTYQNNLKHIHFHIPYLKNTTSTFYIRAGSANESEMNEYGTAHFLEHMLFNGSSLYKESRLQENAYASIGAEVNAYTGKDKTCYYATASNDAFTKKFEILSAQVFSPLLNQHDVKKEIGIIQEERIMGESDPERQLYRKTINQLTKNSLYEHATIGSEESLNMMTRSRLKQFYEQHYTTNNMILVTYGGLEYKDIENAVKDSLDSFVLNQELVDSNVIVPDIEKNMKSRKPIELRFDITSSKYMAISPIVSPQSIEEILSLMVLETYLFEGENGLLNKKLRIENPLLSSHDGGIEVDSQFSYLLLGFSADGEKLSEAIDITKEMLSTVDTTFNQNEFERSIGYLRGLIYRTIESPSDAAIGSPFLPEFYGFQKNLDFSLNDLLKKLDSISLDETKSVWEKALNLNILAEGRALPL